MNNIRTMHFGNSFILLNDDIKGYSDSNTKRTAQITSTTVTELLPLLFVMCQWQPKNSHVSMWIREAYLERNGTQHIIEYTHTHTHK
jgi:hypothetical protein